MRVLNHRSRCGVEPFKSPYKAHRLLICGVLVIIISYGSPIRIGGDVFSGLVGAELDLNFGLIGTGGSDGYLYLGHGRWI